MSFDSIVGTAGLLLGGLCFFGADQRFRGWQAKRSIVRLEKQRAYYIRLAGSDEAKRNLAHTSLFVLAALLFAYLMMTGAYDRDADAKALHVIQVSLGAIGYAIACWTLGRFTRARSLNAYLARIDATLDRLRKQ